MYNFYIIIQGLERRCNMETLHKKYRDLDYRAHLEEKKFSNQQSNIKSQLQELINESYFSPPERSFNKISHKDLMMLSFIYLVPLMIQVLTLIFS